MPRRRHEGRGGLVAGVGPPVDAVEADRAEGQVEHRPGSLASEALALRLGVEEEADLPLTVLGAAHAAT